MDVRKLAKQFVIICLIILAGLGVGLSGGVPIPSIKSRRDPEKDKIELIESETSKSDECEFKG